MKAATQLTTKIPFNATFRHYLRPPLPVPESRKRIVTYRATQRITRILNICMLYNPTIYRNSHPKYPIFPCACPLLWGERYRKWQQTNK